MPNDEARVSGWREAMRIGMPAFDEERIRMLKIVELLDVDPAHGIRGEFFLDRLEILRVVLEKLYHYEETLMDELKLPDDLRDKHRADHDQVMEACSSRFMKTRCVVSIEGLSKYTRR